MKITIDTAQDSHVDIKKAIRLLQSIVEHQEVYTNAPRNIFDSPSPEVSQQPSQASESSPVSAFSNLFDSQPAASEEKKELTEEDVKLELY